MNVQRIKQSYWIGDAEWDYPGAVGFFVDFDELQELFDRIGFEITDKEVEG